MRATALDVGEVTEANAAVLRTAMAPDGELVDLRLARGCRAFAVFAGSEVAAFGWLSTGSEWIGEVGLEIRLHEGEAYAWNCVTLPAHRHRGYFRGLLDTVVGTARAEGLRRLWIGAVDGGAISAVVGAGFTPVLDLATTTVGGVRWIATRPAVDAEPALLAAALSALGGRMPLRSGLRRVRRRRH